MQITIFLRHAYIKHHNSLLSFSDCRTMGFRVPLFVVAVFSFLFVAFSDGAAPKGRKCVFFTFKRKRADEFFKFYISFYFLYDKQLILMF